MITLKDETTITPGDLGNGVFRFDRDGQRLKVGEGFWTVEALEAIVAFVAAANAPKSPATKPRRVRK